MIRRVVSYHSAVLAALGLAATGLHAAGSGPVQFNRDIKPILAEACFHCHGPDPGSRKAGLRLDTEAGFFSAGESPATVVKGQPEKSPLFARITSSDPDEVMPPPESHKNLNPEQKALLERWIKEGAVWEPHWSFIAPKKSEPADVKDTAWARNPIDRFVLSQLESVGLKPAPEADRHTLARRVSLDLTGLPPTAEVLESFVKDTSPDAYEKLVDQLLKSDAYGEHRARYWLDAARYADTHGMHFDNYREMWPYRDWVIHAFNRNQPFDQFTMEQIAGDLLPNRTESQLIATGFQRCNITTNEGGTIDEENLALYASDRVQTLGWVYMGLTTNCAQCHDHKFDPITAKDYYALAAFFRNTTQGAKDGNVKDSGPILVVPSDQDRPRWEALPKDLEATKAAMEKRRKDAAPLFEHWLAQAQPEDMDIAQDALLARFPLNEGHGDEVHTSGSSPRAVRSAKPLNWRKDGKLGDAPEFKEDIGIEAGSIPSFDKNQPFSAGCWVYVDKEAQGTRTLISQMDDNSTGRGWDLSVIGNSFAAHLVSKWPEDALKVNSKGNTVKFGKWQHVLLTYDGSGKASGFRIFINGEADKDLKLAKDSLKGETSATTLRIGQRIKGSPLAGGSIQDVRVYARALGAGEARSLFQMPQLQKHLQVPAEKRSEKQKQELLTHYLETRDAEHQSASKKLVSLDAEQKSIRGRSVVTHVQEEVMNGQPMTEVLLRGQYDKKGESVMAAPPAALPGLPKGAPANRLGLAQWLIDENNPLTTRVTVNRFWQEIFGQGLVKTSEDFGIMGTPPSHPELLDWLALEFRESGWDVKKFFKLLVTSSTYRQAAFITPEKLEKDRDNQLLSRGPRFRMDAEMLRDYALAASNTLAHKIGGPGTRPYQPEEIWNVVGLGGGNTRDYVQDQGEGLYRRTLYNFWKRMAPSPNMEIFNAPSRETSCVRRERTNTPLQALVTMNDPQFVEAARNLAQQAMKHGNGDHAKISDYIAQRVLCRPLTTEEASIIASSQKDLLAHYQNSAEDSKALLEVGDSEPDKTLDAAVLASWTMVSNQIMNLDEVLNK
jgi:hypothetical protein